MSTEADPDVERFCPWCEQEGEYNTLLFYPAEASDEPDVFSCPDCAYTEAVAA